MRFDSANLAASVRRGGHIGGVIGAIGGGAAVALPKTYIDPNTGTKKQRTTKHKIIGGILGASLGGYVGTSTGRIAGALHHLHKLNKKPTWLKNVKTKTEARRAYHNQARKHHPDLHGGSDKEIKKINSEWSKYEHHFKTAMLMSFADELEKIAGIGALLGGAAGFKLSPNSIKGKALGTLAGAGIGSAVGRAGKAAKRTFMDEPHIREDQELYGY